MPRILRNYLISFAIIGVFLGIVHLADLYFKGRTSAEAPPQAIMAGSATSLANTLTP